jgi:hypothetical protein
MAFNNFNHRSSINGFVNKSATFVTLLSFATRRMLAATASQTA